MKRVSQQFALRKAEQQKALAVERQNEVKRLRREKEAFRKDLLSERKNSKLLREELARVQAERNETKRSLAQLERQNGRNDAFKIVQLALLEWYSSRKSGTAPEVRRMASRALIKATKVWILEDMKRRGE